MTIKIFNPNPIWILKRHLISAAMDAGIAVRFNGLWFMFKVDDWNQFLHILWHAYSTLSMEEVPSALEGRLGVSVVMDSGKEYNTQVWFDKDCRGLRYVSLYC